MELTIGETVIHYEEMGRGTPLLLLHAFPMDGRMWREQHVLADIAHVIIPDLRGVGRSSVTPPPYTMEMLGRDMFALLNSLEIDRAVVMGDSLGCYVAFSMYEMHPERFKALVLTDTRPQADNPETKERRQRTVEGLRAEGTSFLSSRIDDLFSPVTHAERPELVAEFKAIAMEQNPEGLAGETLAMATRPDRLKLLPAIRVPTLVLCGVDDKPAPPDIMQEMARMIPGARFHLIPRAGHLSSLENPDEVNRLLRDFLASLPEV
ncbi:MAG TPA: alpha/beta fold hydrolase [Armatimonadota bacterium]|jgi:pimeloyl-ACP methyl ester carboxylesterase